MCLGVSELHVNQLCPDNNILDLTTIDVVPQAGIFFPGALKSKKGEIRVVSRAEKPRQKAWPTCNLKTGKAGSKSNPWFFNRCVF